MAPRFRSHDQSVQAGLRRIALAQIDAAIDALDDRHAPIATVIHEVRKRCKALRGLIRLVRPAFADYATENAAFRDIGRLLSGARDAQVVLATFDALSDGMGDPAMARLRERLCADRDGSAAPVQALAEARLHLIVARRRAERWTLTRHGWDAVSGGLHKSYKRGRRAMAAARDGQSATSHEWRKRARYHGSHAGLLRAMRPKPLGKRVERLGALADLLGERHDIDVLVQRIEQERHDLAGPADQLLENARRRLAALDAAAQALGERVFARKPRKLEQRWHDWWQAWPDRPQS